MRRASPAGGRGSSILTKLEDWARSTPGQAIIEALAQNKRATEIRAF